MAGGDIGGFQHPENEDAIALPTVVKPVGSSPQSIHPAIPRANPHNSVPNYRRRLK
jgi:hypothetical protein